MSRAREGKKWIAKVRKRSEDKNKMGKRKREMESGLRKVQAGGRIKQHYVRRGPANNGNRRGKKKKGADKNSKEPNAARSKQMLKKRETKTMISHSF